jgi:hypothetical protein
MISQERIMFFARQKVSFYVFLHGAVLVNEGRCHAAVRLLFCCLLLSFMVADLFATVPFTMATSGGMKVGDWWSIKGTAHRAAAGYAIGEGSSF